METFVKIDENLIKDLLQTQGQILSLLMKKEKNHVHQSELISLKEAAHIYSMSYDFFYDKVKNGTLKSTKVGRSIRVKKGDIESLIS